MSNVETLEKGGFNPKRVRFLAYGKSGVGKTVFASTWPKPIFIDIEDGLASVRLPVARLGVSDLTEMYEAVSYLYQGDYEYETVVVDSLNALQKMLLRDVVVRFPSVKRPYDSIPGQSDYGKMLNDFIDIIDSIRAIPINIVFLAQVQDKNMDTDDVSPQLIGKSSANEVCRAMDVVGYLFRGDSEGGNSKRRMAFDVPDYVVKDRSGKLPAIIEFNDRDREYEEISRYWR